MGNFLSRETCVEVVVKHNSCDIRDMSTFIDKGLTRLDLSNNKIKTIPKEIKNCTKLTHIDLSLNEIDDDISPLFVKKLSYLDLSYNMINCIDTNIQYCPSLAHLDLSHNNLTMPNISKLYNLKTLILKGCIFMKDPFENIFKIKSLQYLDLCDTPIDELNIPIDSVSNLEYLNLCNTGLLTFPCKIVDFPKLEYLNLSYNMFYTTPYIPCCSKSIKEFVFVCPDISKLPEFITEIKYVTIHSKSLELFDESEYQLVNNTHSYASNELRFKKNST